MGEKDVSWSHISIWTPSEVSKAFSCCERALPMRHKIRNRFKTHSNLEHLQKSVEPSILPAEYGGSVSTKDCIISWKKELEENRATVLELDTMKVEQGPVEREHTPVVRKKSRHDSGSQVLGMVGSMRKHEWQNEQ